MPLPHALADIKTSGLASGRLVAAAAHELKNPMEAMNSLLYLLQQNPSLDPSARKHVAVLREELERMRVVVAQTLGIYREAARPGAVKVSEVLDDILGFYAHKVRYKEIAVQKRGRCSEVIEAVHSEIRQVFTNLVVNALEALPVGGKLTLHTSSWRSWGEPPRKGVRVIVADNGPGIRPEHRHTIWNPSFTTKGDKGNGLGLWVSKGIVDKYGGSIRVRSRFQPDKSGTVFSVFLPGRELNIKEIPKRTAI